MGANSWLKVPQNTFYNSYDNTNSNLSVDTFDQINFITNREELPEALNDNKQVQNIIIWEDTGAGELSKPQIQKQHINEETNGENEGKVDIKSIYYRDQQIGKFKCKACSYVSNHSGHMREHIIAIHVPQRKECPHCKKIVKMGSSWRSHVSKCSKR